MKSRRPHGPGPGPHLPAAVSRNPSAVRMVPARADVLKAGSVTMGYWAHPKRHFGQAWTLPTQRLAEIEALVQHRHGGPCDTDDGEIYVQAALPHIIAIATVPGTPMHRTQAVLWANLWTPRVLDERTIHWFIEIEKVRSEQPRGLRADTLGKLLGVTKEERRALGLRTIRAKGQSKRDLTADRKASDREYQRLKRAQAGATPRSASKAALKPWESVGLSRSAWYRQQASGTSSSASFTPQKSGAGTGSSGLRYYISELPTLPSQVRDAVQLSLLGEPQADDVLRTALDGRHSGRMPEAVRVGYLAAKRRRAVRQVDVARAIQISRPQFANALARTFSLSPEAIERLKVWLVAEDGALPPAPAADEIRSARPHHRRGGKRAPNPGPMIPALRLFTLIAGEGSMPRSGAFAKFAKAAAPLQSIPDQRSAGRSAA